MILSTPTPPASPVQGGSTPTGGSTPSATGVATPNPNYTPGGGGTAPGSAGGATPNPGGANPSASGTTGSGNTPPPTPSAAVTPGLGTGALPPSLGRASPRGGYRSAPTARPKRAGLGLRHLPFPWRTGFLPEHGTIGYGTHQLRVDQAVSIPESAGGFGKSGRPVLVLTFDGSSERHQQALETLESDDRLKAAAHFFRCVRVDTRGQGGPSKSEISLRAYLPNGEFFGEERGTRRVPNPLSLLEKAFEASFQTGPGSAINWAAESLVRQEAAHRAVAAAEQQIVCAHCGKCEPHIRKLVDEMRAEARKHDEALEVGLAQFRR